MSALGTAEAELDTAVVEEAPPLAPETDELDTTPETDGSESPETDEATELTEDDPRVVPILEARETAHKAELASLQESYRRREENARIAGRSESLRQIQESVSRVSIDGIYAEVAKLVEKAAESGEMPDEAKLQGFIRAASTLGQLSQPDAMLAVTNTWLKRDHNPFYKAAEERTDLNDLWRDAAATGNPYESFVASLQIAAMAGEEKGYAKGKADAEKELREKAKASTKTEQIKAAGEAARNESGPTSLNGIGRPGRVLTGAQIEAMPMREWTALPQAERDRLRAAALQLAEKARRR